MAVPKKKTSVSRKGMRRGGQTHKLYKKDTGTCANCGNTVLSHHACPSCGMYKGKQIFEIKVRAKKEEGNEPEQTNA